MSAEPEDRPYSETDLDSPEYRARLKHKLDCLIAVLEVAGAKVRRTLAGPDADVERLQRIEKNLSDTLLVCRRARQALDQRGRLPKDLPAKLEAAMAASPLLPPPAAQRAPGAPSDAMIVEMSSADEFEKFRTLEPIRRGDVAGCDLDELCRRLQSG